MGNTLKRGSRVKPILIRNTGTMTNNLKKKDVKVGPNTFETIDDANFVACAVSSISQDEITLTWKLENFKEHVQLAACKDKRQIEEFQYFMPFNQKHCRGFGECGVYLSWVLKLLSRDEIEALPKYANADVSKIPWGIVQLVMEKEDVAFEISRDLCCSKCKKLLEEFYFRIAVDIYVDGLRFPNLRSAVIRHVNEGTCGWNFLTIMKEGERYNYVQADGSLLLALTTTAFFPIEDSQSSIKVTKNSNKLRSKARALKVKKQCKDGIVVDLDSLLRDNTTPDVMISLRKMELNYFLTGHEVGRVYGHKAILAVRCPKFRELIEDERKKVYTAGITILTIFGLSEEVMRLFMSFLYTGSLRVGSYEGQGDDSLWENYLEELLDIAEKYKVPDLKAYIEAHLYQVVTKRNIEEMYLLAQTHKLLNSTENQLIFEEYSNQINAQVNPAEHGDEGEASDV